MKKDTDNQLLVWDLVKYKNKDDKRIFKILETWLDWTAHEEWSAVTIKCLNCNIDFEDNDWIYDEPTSDLIKIKDYVKDIIINSLWEDLNIITDSDDLLQFPFFDKISLVDNSMNSDNFRWTVIYNLNPFNNNKENKENIIVALDIFFDSKDNNIQTEIYYNIDWNNYNTFEEMIEDYKKIEDISEQEILELKKDANEIDLKTKQIIWEIN